MDVENGALCGGITHLRSWLQQCFSLRTEFKQGGELLKMFGLALGATRSGCDQDIEQLALGSTTLEQFFNCKWNERCEFALIEGLKELRRDIADGPELPVFGTVLERVENCAEKYAARNRAPRLRSIFELWLERAEGKISALPTVEYLADKISRWHACDEFHAQLSQATGLQCA